jgi:hypothetical protein
VIRGGHSSNPLSPSLRTASTLTAKLDARLKETAVQAFLYAVAVLVTHVFAFSKYCTPTHLPRMPGVVCRARPLIYGVLLSKPNFSRCHCGAGRPAEPILPVVSGEPLVASSRFLPCLYFLMTTHPFDDETLPRYVLHQGLVRCQFLLR